MSLKDAEDMELMYGYKDAIISIVNNAFFGNNHEQTKAKKKLKRYEDEMLRRMGAEDT